MLRREPWWWISDEFVNGIDEVIDRKYRHDVGKRSMRKLLKALFIEWGDLHTASGALETTKEEREGLAERIWGKRLSPYEYVVIPRLGPVLASELHSILLYVPDEALLLGLLHHFLDLCAEYVNKHDVVSWSLAKDYALSKMRAHKEFAVSEGLKTMMGENVWDMFERCLKVLDKHGDEIVSALVDEKLKRRSP